MSDSLHKGTFNVYNASYNRKQYGKGETAIQKNGKEIARII